MDSDPSCPQWNMDEWESFGVVIGLAMQWEEMRLLGIGPMPSVLATGALLQHCFPEKFEALYNNKDDYRL